MTNAVWVNQSNDLGQTHALQVHTSAKVPLGTRRQFRDRANGYYVEAVYLLGVTSTVTGLMVTWNASTHQTALSANTGDTGNPIAVAMGATTATAKYGWYAVAGIRPVKKTAVTVEPQVAVYQSATVGRIMDTVASGKQIVGMRAANLTTVTSTTSTVVCEFNHPHVEIGATG